MSVFYGSVHMLVDSHYSCEGVVFIIQALIISAVADSTHKNTQKKKRTMVNSYQEKHRSDQNALADLSIFKNHCPKLNFSDR